MATPKKGYRYFGFYVPEIIADRFERLYPHLKSLILRNFVKYAINNKADIVEKFISED